MNGQVGRKAIVYAVVEHVAPTVVVETGTHRGATARYLARTTGLPVYTVEVDAPTYRRARRRLRHVANVHPQLGDSRSFLRDLPHAGVPDTATALFYLDAHWWTDLPLLEELKIIEQTWRDWVAIVDDFEVPDDPAYGYDDYGPGKALRPEYLAVAGFPKRRLHVPALPGARESGARRGCVVLGSPGRVDAALGQISLLRRFG